VWENYQPSMEMGFPLSVLCSMCPMDRNVPQAAEIVFLFFEEQVTCKIKNKISVV
jgi:hypothetical protein